MNFYKTIAAAAAAFALSAPVSAGIVTATFVSNDFPLPGPTTGTAMIVLTYDTAATGFQGDATYQDYYAGGSLTLGDRQFEPTPTPDLCRFGVSSLPGLQIAVSLACRYINTADATDSQFVSFAITAPYDAAFPLTPPSAAAFLDLYGDRAFTSVSFDGGLQGQFVLASVDDASIPEPAALSLLGLAVLGITASRRRPS
jgi:hypothetical protein